MNRHREKVSSLSIKWIMTGATDKCLRLDTCEVGALASLQKSVYRI